MVFPRETRLERALVLNPVALVSLDVSVGGCWWWDFSGLVSLRVLNLSLRVVSGEQDQFSSIARSLPRSCHDVRLRFVQDVGRFKDAPIISAEELHPCLANVTSLSLPPSLVRCVVYLWAFLSGLRRLELAADRSSMSMALIVSYLVPTRTLRSLTLSDSMLFRAVPADMFPGLTELGLLRCPAAEIRATATQDYFSRLGTFRFAGNPESVPWSLFRELEHLELEAWEPDDFEFELPAQPVDLSPLTKLRSLRLVDCELPEEAWDMPELESLEFVLKLDAASNLPPPGRLPRSRRLRRLHVDLGYRRDAQYGRRRDPADSFLAQVLRFPFLPKTIEDLRLGSLRPLGVRVFELPVGLRQLELRGVDLNGVDLNGVDLCAEASRSRCPWIDLAHWTPRLETLRVESAEVDRVALRRLLSDTLVLS